MPRRDIYHTAVRIALEKEAWIITNDPLTVPTPGLEFHIDLGAVKEIISAKRGEEEIAVEIKSLRGNSVFYDYHQALGQFMMYRLALKMSNKKHLLYLAIPEAEYKRLEKVQIYKNSWQEFSMNLLIFNEINQQVVQWIRY